MCIFPPFPFSLLSLLLLLFSFLHARIFFMASCSHPEAVLLLLLAGSESLSVVSQRTEVNFNYGWKFAYLGVRKFTHKFRTLVL